MTEQTKVVTVDDLQRPDLQQHLQSIINHYQSLGYDYVNSHNLPDRMTLFFQLPPNMNVNELGPKSDKELLLG